MAKTLTKEQIERKRHTTQKWDENNRTRKSDYQKEWYKENKNRIRKIQNEYNNLRIKNDILFKLKKYVSSGINKCLKRKNLKKDSRTHEILGCTYDGLKNHIESKFQSWMNWENYGKYNGDLNCGWDIDHIKPLSTAKTEDELIKLMHFSNLQPLCSKINRDIKKAKI